MLAAVTSKGQLTLPKAIRQQLNLGQGSRLDFSVNEQGWLMARPVTNTALGLAGILRRRGQAAVSIAAMADAVEATAAVLGSHLNSLPTTARFTRSRLPYSLTKLNFPINTKCKKMQLSSRANICF